MVTRVIFENVWSVSNATLVVSVSLARTPLPDLSAVSVILAGRVLITQESAWENWNGSLKLVMRVNLPRAVVDAVGKIFVPYLFRRGRPSIPKLRKLLL